MNAKLYSLGGAYPAPLPFRITLANGDTRTDPSSFTDGEIAEAGFVEAPVQPDHDPVRQRVDWIDGAWVVSDLPPAPEPEPLPPISLTVGEFVGRFRIPEENAAFDALDDAMMAEARLVRRNWGIDSYRFTEGDGFWTIIAGHLDAIVTAERKAELLARTGEDASFAEPAMAA